MHSNLLPVTTSFLITPARPLVAPPDRSRPPRQFPISRRRRRNIRNEDRRRPRHRDGDVARISGEHSKKTSADPAVQGDMSAW